MHFKGLSATAGLLLLASSPIALAQTSGAANGAAPVAGETGIPDIVVTAQRFTESGQKTPLVLSVISADALKGVSQVTQLSTVDPSLQVANGGGLVQTFIRGVGSATVLTGQESAISYNVDGVYLYSSSMITPQMYDLDRIEVLKGPQGTLYGRNSSGGALNIITAGAKLGKTEGYVDAEIGNYDRQSVIAAVNLPVSDTFAVRLAGEHVKHSGYLSDGSMDQDLDAGRIRARWEPSADVTLLVGADVSYTGGRGFGSSVSPNPTSNPFIGSADPAVNQGGTALFTTQNNPSFVKNHQWSVNAQLDVNLDFATLTILPAFRHELGAYTDYAPGFGDNQHFETNEKTIEARLANRSDRMKWVVGTYFFKNDNAGTSTVNQNLIGSLSVAAQSFHVTSYAFFGETTYSVSDAFRVIGGLRYSHEKTTTGGTANGLLPPGSPAFNPYDPVTNPTGERADFNINGLASAGAVTWKGGVELDLTPSSMLFATASRGFKGGGAYVNSPGLPSTYNPEYLTAFELGSRNRFLDNTLQLNGELFYWKLKDQQQTFLSNNAFNVPVLATVNAGRSHMYGGNIDIVWRPTPDDTLRGGVEYTKSKYDAFTRVLPAFAVIPTTTCAVTSSGPGPFANTTVNCAGKPMVRSPKWVANAGYEHRFDLASGAGVIFNADMSFSSGRYLDLNYINLAYQGPKALFNSSLTFETPNKAITLTAWIRNIANSRVGALSVEFTPFYVRPTLLPPRTFGGGIRYAF